MSVNPIEAIGGSAPMIPQVLPTGAAAATPSPAVPNVEGAAGAE